MPYNPFDSRDEKHTGSQCVQILRFRAKVALFAPSLRHVFFRLRKAQKLQKVALFGILEFLCSKIGK